MENLRRENERLKVDNQDLENEVFRLRDELAASHGVAPPTHRFNPSVKNEFDRRPMSPPESLERSTSPKSVPSLTHTSSPTAPSLDVDPQIEMQKPLFADNTTAFGHLTVDPTDLKHSDDSRSAVTCSLQWTSEMHQAIEVSPPLRRSQRVRVKAEGEW